MKLKFDSTQVYQIQAVSSFIDLFEGQPLKEGDYAAEIVSDISAGQGSLFQSESGIGNKLVIDAETILKNLQAVQERNDLDITTVAEFEKNGMNFSVEMETGTGKTYVYLRTIFELSEKYGFKKFIIVVPGVAIREGALSNIKITSDHFKALYNNIAFEHFVYDSKKPGAIRQFATSNILQIMIINIDAFNKDTNIFNLERNQLNGYSPREFINAVRPFVLIDEPQSVDNTEKARDAIKSLNPVCIFRFSATHKNPYNLIYKLDPIKAYELRLVKQIIVASVTGENTQNAAYIKLLETDNKKGIRAKIKIQVQGRGEVKEKEIWVKQSDDLYTLSEERYVYQDNFQVTDISCEPGNEFIDFNSDRLYLGEERGGITEDLMSAQIRKTIEKHLEKELQLKNHDIKVLSLFFVDRVANYRIYDAEGKPKYGKYAELFEQHYRELIQKPQYKVLDIFPVEKLHDGYFSQDKKGTFKDTNGGTLADDDTYAKIMSKKEELLSKSEPLKFIFSHSALREGWDNPNVFQICVLREIAGMNERRQTLGRGMRLPVNGSGERVKDDNINKLTVIARETYTDFAAGLQKEYEEDCGVIFGRVNKIAFTKLIDANGETEKPIGRAQSELIWQELQTRGFIDTNGKILPTFNPAKEGFDLGLSEQFSEHDSGIISVMQSFQLDRHIKPDVAAKKLKINREIFNNPEFENLWNKIKFRTTYQVDYSTEELIRNAIRAVKQMDKIEASKIDVSENLMSMANEGIAGYEIKRNTTDVQYAGTIPDILAYLQKETELTRSTLVKIITGSNRLKEFIIHPQKFMDGISAAIKSELKKLTINGIQYEKLTAGETEWSMHLFEKDLKDYFGDSIAVAKSVYYSILYDSDVEMKFAQALDNRNDIKLFVKLPSWFFVDTPVGKYNPDWAIVKEDDSHIYLVRETKGNKKFDTFRGSEKQKVDCGKKHFEALGVDYAVVVSAEEI